MRRPHAQDAFLGEPPKLVTMVTLCPPNPACMVCGRNQLQLRINTRTTTLVQLLDKVTRRRLAGYLRLGVSVL